MSRGCAAAADARVQCASVIIAACGGAIPNVWLVINAIFTHAWLFRCAIFTRVWMFICVIVTHGPFWPARPYDADAPLFIVPAALPDAVPHHACAVVTLTTSQIISLHSSPSSASTSD